ncbi:MAG: SLBB domain-containing protein [Ignavibacteriales bacterium]|nr:SLBB domain-containing protein [Ignavibacteriales bacterium]
MKSYMGTVNCRMLMKNISKIFLFLLVVSFSISQEKQQTTILDELGLFSQEKRVQNVVQPTGVPLESTINPEKYYVGPSDLIAVNIWMSPPMNFSLNVTPEGTLIIPTIGEVMISDLTLAQAKVKILNEARKKYLSAEITVTLIKPRPIIVTVTGNVLNAGLYTLSSVDRTTKAIEEANKPSRLQTQGDLSDVIYWMSLRNIVLKHREGSQDRVDIIKFLATKEDKWNPYLREGDVVIVPRKNPTKNVIGIYGEINAPGRYEYADGDSLLDAIKIGMGFTRLALSDSIEFSRQNVSGTALSTTIINIDDVIANKQPNFPLEPGDRIVVKAKTELREHYRVTIVGEVLYPGTYPITKNRTKLSEVIRQAGGFTEFAAFKSASLNRRSIQTKEVEIERLLSARGGVSLEDSLDYFLETELRLRKEIVNVDFEKLFIDADSSQDIILQDEDYIVVPSIKKTIYVFGQVVTPGHVPFIQDMSSEYYITKAGGFTDRARKGDMKIIKSKTKQWLDPDETTIEDGDYIWVPKDPDRPFAYYMTIASQAASVLSVVIGIAVVIVQVTKP